MMKNKAKIGFFLHNIPFFNVNVKYQDIPTHITCENNFRYKSFMSNCESNFVDIEFSLYHSYELYYYINKLKYKSDRNFGINYTVLGSGYICEYCGHYQAKGVFICQRCNSLCSEKEMIEPENIKVYFANMNMHRNIFQKDDNLIDISFSLKIHIDNLDKLFDNTLNLPIHSLNIVDNFYLCQWCGMSVEEGKDCYGCGGTKKPLQQLIEYDRNCLWCGTKVKGNLMCSNCGIRQSGLTLEEYLNS